MKEIGSTVDRRRQFWTKRAAKAPRGYDCWRVVNNGAEETRRRSARYELRTRARCIAASAQSRVSKKWTDYGGPCGTRTVQDSICVRREGDVDAFGALVASKIRHTNSQTPRECARKTWR